MSPAVRRLLVAHGLSAAAMGLPWPALLVAVWETTHDDGLLGAAGAARLAPYIVLSWLAGRLADRCARGWMVRASLVGRIVALAAMACALAAGQVGVAVALGCLAVACGTPAYPAIAAELPMLARDGVETATGLLVTLEVAAFFVGPALGGLAMGFVSPAAAGWLAVAMTGASLALVRGVPWSSRAVDGSDPGPAPVPLTAVWRRHPIALRAVVVLAVNNLVSGAIAIALLPVALEVWRGDSTDFGAATTALGFGALAAPVLLAMWGLSRRAGRFSTVVLGSVLLAMSLAPNLWWALAPLVVAAAAAVHVEAVATRLIQQAAPEHARSSVLGLADSVMIAAAAVGAGVTPWLATVVGARGVIVMCALTGLCMLALLRGHDLPDGTREPDPAPVDTGRVPMTRDSMTAA